MPNYCCVPMCRNKGGHKFPTEPSLRKKWQIAIKRVHPVKKTLWVPGPAAVVCSEHFGTEDYTDTLLGERRRLKPDAVPKLKKPKESRRLPGFCFVPYCGNEIGGHLFPTNTEVKNQWINAIKAEKEPTPASVVCHHHFKPSDYREHNLVDRLRWRLLPTAVPSVFLCRQNKSLVNRRAKASSRTSRRQWMAHEDSQYCTTSNSYPEHPIQLESCNSIRAIPFVLEVYDETKQGTQLVVKPGSETMFKNYTAELSIKAEEEDAWTLENECHPRTCSLDERDSTEKSTEYSDNVLKTKTNSRAVDNVGKHENKEMEFIEDKVKAEDEEILHSDSNNDLEEQGHDSQQVRHQNHSKEKTVEGSDCSKSDSPYRVIRYTTRTGKRIYQCKACRKYFVTSDSMKKHALVHSGKKPFECGFCKKMYIHMDSLNKHMRIHTGNQRATCPVCCKKFTTINNLAIHSLKHSSEKLFECDTCAQIFANDTLLAEHRTVHSEKIWQFWCQDCEKSFSHAHYHLPSELFIMKTS